MRLTLAGGPGSPSLDLDLPDDARLGDLRPHLAEVTGRPELADPATVLAVEETVLAADQLTGQLPLVAGAVLQVGAGTPDADRLALRSSWHVAVISGPDSGALAALGVGDRRGAIVVGRAGHLALDDDGISRRHLELTLGRSGPRVRDLGSSNGTLVLRAGRGHAAAHRRGRRLGRGPTCRASRAVRVRAGDRLSIGASVLEVRRGWSDRHAPARPRDGSADHRPSAGGMSLGMWFGPAIGSLVLAMSTGNRLLLVLALLGPAVALWPVLRGRAARRRVRRTGRARPGHPLRARRGDGAGAAESPSVADELLVPSPADLTTHVLACLTTVASVDAPEGWPGVGLRRLAPDACVAVVGPRSAALGVARALVAAALLVDVDSPAGGTTGVVVRAAGGRAADWAWCRWLTRGDPADGAAPVHPLLIADGCPGNGRTADLARRWAGGHGATIVLVETDRARVPPWCRTVLEVTPGAAVAMLDLPDGARRRVPLRAVSAQWADVHARRVAAVRHRAPAFALPTGPDAAGRAAAPVRAPAPPHRVALADLPGIPEPDGPAVAACWDAPRGPLGGLAACLGLGPGGAPVELDLVRDGPHALVAGTTGAGKSELLQSLLLSLALTHSPAELAIALIDYKGGASFGACADLPHVVGQVTDLDPSLAGRALSGLRAELRSRERALAAAGVSDLAALRALRADLPGGPPVPPRLLVVVDEFRALTEDLPTFVPGLLRLAAQGRSLGIHLVLATQRPAGAVGPDLRANLAVRIALRVTDAADSLDVIDVPDAARIPAGLPGRAMLRRGAGPVEPVQIAHADGAAGDRAAAVRIAADWVAERVRGWTPAGSVDVEPPPPARTTARAYVDAARAAAALTGVRLPEPPWLAPLPERVSARDLLVAGGHGETGTLETGNLETGRRGLTRNLPLALADLPAEQRRAVLSWDPLGGNLLVLGAPGSGRSTALHTVAAAALERGWHVHAVGLPARLLAGLSGHPCLGTVVGPDDPRRLARLVTLLGSPPRPGGARDGIPQLLLVDGLEAAAESLGAVGRGAGAERLLDLLRTGRSRAVAVAASAGGSGSGPVASQFTERLVLAVGDRLAEAVAGVPADLAGARRGPGRAIRLAPPGGTRGPAPADDAGAMAAGRSELGAVLCQVAVSGSPADPSGLDEPSTPRARPHRISPLPDRVGVSALASGGPCADASADAPRIGLGGDDGGPVRLDVSRGALVVGPPGSGRSTALAVIAAALLDAGRPIIVIARDGPLRVLGAARAPATTCGFSPDAIGRLLATLPCEAVVLVDDLDGLEQQTPAVAEQLAALVSGADDTVEPAGPAGPSLGRAPVVVASAQTARAAMAYRGALGALRATRRGLLLGLAEPGSGEVLGVGLEWVIDPAHPHAPGRGARQHGRDLVPVQVLDPDLP